MLTLCDRFQHLSSKHFVKSGEGGSVYLQGRGNVYGYVFRSRISTPRIIAQICASLRGPKISGVRIEFEDEIVHVITAQNKGSE